MHSQFSFYKNHVSEIKLVISYQFLCAENEYDTQIAKLALVFLKLQSERNQYYIVKCILMNSQFGFKKSCY